MYLGLVKLLGLTSRVGEHQSRNVASNPSQTGEHSTGQDAKLSQSNKKHEENGQCHYLLSIVHLSRAYQRILKDNLRHDVIKNKL